MRYVLSCSIDLSRIDRSKIVIGKNGAKYYNFDVLVMDEKNQYDNDVALSQRQTKQQRDAGDKREWIGNGRTVWENKGKPDKEEKGINEELDDLPF